MLLDMTQKFVTEFSSVVSEEEKGQEKELAKEDYETNDSSQESDRQSETSELGKRILEPWDLDICDYNIKKNSCPFFTDEANMQDSDFNF